MTRSALTADSEGPGLQQELIAAVANSPTPHGDYGVHVGVTHVLPGAASKSLQHDVTEVVVMISGELEAWIDGVRSTIRRGDHFTISPGVWHRFANASSASASMLFAFGGDPGPVTRSRVPEVEVGEPAEVVRAEESVRSVR